MGCEGLPIVSVSCMLNGLMLFFFVLSGQDFVELEPSVVNCGHVQQEHADCKGIVSGRFKGKEGSDLSDLQPVLTTLR